MNNAAVMDVSERIICLFLSCFLLFCFHVRGDNIQTLCSQSPNLLPPRWNTSCDTSDFFCRFRATSNLTKFIDKVIESIKEHTRLSTFLLLPTFKDYLATIQRLDHVKNILADDDSFPEITDNREDEGLWNNYIETAIKQNGGRPLRFSNADLTFPYDYVFRAIIEDLSLSSYLKTFDPFRRGKENALISSEASQIKAARYLLHSKENDVFKKFEYFLTLEAWGNKCDLSISDSCVLIPQQPSQSMLVNHVAEIWKILSNARRIYDKIRVDIILDNSGLELFTDLCVADLFLQLGLADVIYFHLKSIPWSVSDVTPVDFHWSLQYLASHNYLFSLGQRWQTYVTQEKWKLHTHKFWTTPFLWIDMEHKASDLYSFLQTSNLLIFKGEYNYMKLIQDRSWKGTEPFEVGLGCFRPAPICSIRSIKVNRGVGLTEHQLAQLNEETSKNHPTIRKFLSIQCTT